MEGYSWWEPTCDRIARWLRGIEGSLFCASQDACCFERSCVPYVCGSSSRGHSLKHGLLPYTHTRCPALNQRQPTLMLPFCSRQVSLHASVCVWGCTWLLGMEAKTEEVGIYTEYRRGGQYIQKRWAIYIGTSLSCAITELQYTWAYWQTGGLQYTLVCLRLFYFTFTFGT